MPMEPAEQTPERTSRSPAERFLPKNYSRGQACLWDRLAQRTSGARHWRTGKVTNRSGTSDSLVASSSHFAIMSGIHLRRIWQISNDIACEIAAHLFIADSHCFVIWR